MGRQRKESKNGERSQRQLRVGEEIRHLLSTILLRGSFHEPELEDVPVTISEVSVSPDFSNASVYIVPLGGGNADVIEALGRITANLQHQLSQQLTIRRTPRLKFHIDTSFDNASRINSLIDATSAKGEAE